MTPYFGYVYDFAINSLQCINIYVFNFRSTFSLVVPCPLQNREDAGSCRRRIWRGFIVAKCPEDRRLARSVHREHVADTWHKYRMHKRMPEDRLEQGSLAELNIVIDTV